MPAFLLTTPDKAAQRRLPTTDCSQNDDRPGEKGWIDVFKARVDNLRCVEEISL